MLKYEAAKNVLGSRTRSLDIPIVLLSAGALLLVGPLRDAVGAYPLLLFLGTLFLFMMPGLLLAHWFLGEHFSGAALVPVSFTISAGIFGLLGVPVLMAHLSIEAYLWVIGAVLAASLTAAMLRAASRKPTAVRGDDAPAGPSFRELWAPFLLLSAALSLVSRWKVQHPYNDIWVYLAYVREFLDASKLALYEPYFGDETELSRVQINGWLLIQAALSRISGIDPVELVLKYLVPTLVLVTLLAFYALARTLLKNEGAALLSGSLYALFFLIHLDPSILSFGGEFISRVAEDKFSARFIFLPMALAFAVAYLEGRKLRYLALFAFTCWSVIAVHPVGLAIIGLSMAGFGLVHLVLNLRSREAWTKMVSLGVALLSVVFIPVLYVLATGNSLVAVLKSADISSHDPEVLANMVFVKPGWKHIYVLADGSYIMHPSLVLNPVILSAFLLGVPFLLWRVRRSLAAQLLLGVLLLTTAMVYVPPIATFLGNNVVLPGQLWRLAWPIPLAALLTLGWMVWEATRYAVMGLSRLGIGVARFFPLVLVVALMAAAWPSAVAGARDIYRAEDEAAQVHRSCYDPIFRWIGDNISKPSVVLAPDLENTCIPAYSAQANVVSLRGGLILKVLPKLERRTNGRVKVSQGVQDVRSFFHRPTQEEVVRILHHHEVDYVMIPTKSHLDERLAHMPGFLATNSPRQRYALYAVDLRKVGARS